MVVFDEIAILKTELQIKGIRMTERRELRKSLSRIIHNALSLKEHCHYYQGFHDIVSVFLILLQEESAFHSISNLMDVSVTLLPPQQ